MIIEREYTFLRVLRFTKEELNMEIRIVKLSMLLNRAVEGSAKTNTNSENNDDQFMASLQDGQAKEESSRQEKKEADSLGVASQNAMLSLSAKGIKHSSLMTWREAMEAEGIAMPDEAEEGIVYSQAQMTDRLQGLSSQVVNGELSATDKMNFDTELKALMALIDNADDSKCAMISERIDDLSRIINDATVYRSNHIAVFKLTDPDYDKK